MSNNNLTTTKRRSWTDYQDNMMLFKSMLPIKTMVGLGMILGAAPATILLMSSGSSHAESSSLSSSLSSLLLWTPLLVGTAMVFAGTLSKVLVTAMTGKSSDPLTKLVVRGRKTAVIKGDFVVFHIGARANKQVDGFFAWMGDAMQAITKELEEKPELGCLGSEVFHGITGAILIQYWRSLDHLNLYARNRSNEHASPWAKLMAMGRQSADYAFFHEAFEVKDGNYEVIYANCPPMLLGNCRLVDLVQCEGRMNSATGRARKTDGSDYATEFGKPDY